MTGGADLAASYRETVGDYIRAEVIAFDSLVKDRSDSIESFARALRGIEQDRLERMDLIGYDPIAERADATLSDAIGSAAPCGMPRAGSTSGSSGIAVASAWASSTVHLRVFTFGDLAIRTARRRTSPRSTSSRTIRPCVARRIRVTKR